MEIRHGQPSSVFWRHICFFCRGMPAWGWARVAAQIDDCFSRSWEGWEQARRACAMPWEEAKESPVDAPQTCLVSLLDVSETGSFITCGYQAFILEIDPFICPYWVFLLAYTIDTSNRTCPQLKSCLLSHSSPSTHQSVSHLVSVCFHIWLPKPETRVALDSSPHSLHPINRVLWFLSPA